PYLNENLDDLRARMERATGAEKKRLQGLLEEGGWGAMQLYARLSPAERLALRNGQELKFSLDAPAPDRRLPAEWAQPVVRSWNVKVTLHPNGITVGSGEQRLTDAPNAKPTVSLAINRSELGQLSLEGSLAVMIPNEGGSVGTSTRHVLAVGRSPSVAKPDNA